MQTYSATIRLSGSLFNEVRRDTLSPAEIVILKRIHGNDAVINIVPGKRSDASDEQERERLSSIYAKALAGIENVRTLDALLGPPGVPLPKIVPGIDSVAVVKAPVRAKKQDEPAPEPVADPIPVEEFS